MELVRLYNRGNVNIGLGIDELVSNFGPVSLANLRQSIADAYKNSFEYGGRLADDRLERDNALPIKIIFEGNASDINSFRESLRNNSSRDVYTTSVILLRATLRN
jgi:hypothetical protein